MCLIENSEKLHKLQKIRQTGGTDISDCFRMPQKLFSANNNLLNGAVKSWIKDRLASEFFISFLT